MASEPARVRSYTVQNRVHHFTQLQDKNDLDRLRSNPIPSSSLTASTSAVSTSTSTSTSALAASSTSSSSTSPSPSPSSFSFRKDDIERMSDTKNTSSILTESTRPVAHTITGFTQQQLQSQSQSQSQPQQTQQLQQQPQSQSQSHNNNQSSKNVEEKESKESGTLKAPSISQSTTEPVNTSEYIYIQERTGGATPRTIESIRMNTFGYKAPPVPPHLNGEGGGIGGSSTVPYGSSSRLYSRMQVHPGNIKPRVETSLGKKSEHKSSIKSELENAKQHEGSESDSDPSSHPRSTFKKSSLYTNTHANGKKESFHYMYNNNNNNNNNNYYSGHSASTGNISNSTMQTQNRKYTRKIDSSYNPIQDPGLGVLNPLQMTLDQTFAGVTSPTNSSARLPDAPGSPLTLPFKSLVKEKQNIPVTFLKYCNIEVLLGQMKHGTECLNSFAHAIKLFSKEQIKQCEETLKLLHKSKQEYSSLEFLPNFTFAMELVHHVLQETLENQKEFAQFLDTSVLSIIGNLEKTCDSEYLNICNLKKMADKNLKKLKNEAAKLRKETSDAAGVVVKSRQKSSVKEASGPRISDGKSSLALLHRLGKNKGLSDKSKVSQDADYLKARNVEKQFQAAVNKYNAELRKYNEEYEGWKQEVINIEHLRIKSMMSVFNQLVVKQKQIQTNKKLTTLHHDITVTVDKLDPRQEMEKLVHFCVEKHGKYSPMEEQKVALDLEYRDVFLSIEDAMAVTREMNPNATIPYIVPLLCEKVKGLNGFHTEGIFRVSASSIDVKKLRNKLRVKDFSFDDDNVHTYASCLKEWLRSLEDPLIPELYYEFCVDMAKKRKLDQGQFEVFFSQLPAVNRETLKYLVKFLRDLIEPQNVKITLMGLDNLAIVFGPTLLRTETLDPTTALMNAQSEKAFVIALIEKS